MVWTDETNEDDGKFRCCYANDMSKYEVDSFSLQIYSDIRDYLYIKALEKLLSSALLYIK